MKSRDYIRLGRMSLKSRKKSTRNTVFGIAFGLALLIPVLFFSLSFYSALSGAINSLQSFRTLTVAVNAEDESVSEKSTFTYSRADGKSFEEQTDLVKSVYYAEYYVANGGSYSAAYKYSVTIDGIRMMQTGLESSAGVDWGDKEVADSSVGAGKIKLVDTEKSGGYLPSGIAADLDLQGSTFLSAGILPAAKGEVLISERMARIFYGLFPSEAVGKKLSFTGRAAFATCDYDGNVGQGYFRDNDTDPNNTPVYAPKNSEKVFEIDVIHEFKIAGIISADYYGLNSITAKDAHIWLPRTAAYEPGANAPKYLPALTREYAGEINGSPRYRQIVTYAEDMFAMQEKAASEKMIFPAVPVVTFATLQSLNSVVLPLSHTRPVSTVTYECKSFSAANKLAILVDGCYAQATGAENYSYARIMAAPSGFGRFQVVYNVGRYVTVTLYVVGGIVLFATLLNLYNSVNYSVQIRKNYLGMMRAIGADGGVLPKLYFFEISIIFFRSLLCAVPVSAAMSLEIMRLVNSYLGKEVSDGLTVAELLGISFELNFAWYFLALAIACSAIFLVALLYSYFTCRKLARDGITNILEGDK